MPSEVLGFGAVTDGRTLEERSPEALAAALVVPADRLAWRCPAPPPLGALPGGDDETVGQERALAALELGFAVPSAGYNVFVTGLPGSGRTYTIQKLLERLGGPRRAARDRAYVHNFEERSRPRLLSFPAGRARSFAAAMRALVESVKLELPRALESDAALAERQAITRRWADEEKELFRALEVKVVGEGLTLVQIEEGPLSMQAILPFVGQTAVPFETLRAESEARRAFWEAEEKRLAALGRTPPSDEAAREAHLKTRLDELEELAERLGEELQQVLKQARRIHREARRELAEAKGRVARRVIGEQMADLEAEWTDPAVRAHLTRVLDHMLGHLELFDPLEELHASAGEEDDDDGPELGELLAARDSALRIYEVNVVLDASEPAGPPVILERHPTFVTLFGTIERGPAPRGDGRPDFTCVRGGSLLRADGGFLVMYARDVLLEPGAWRNLVRTLRSRLLEIQAPESALYLAPYALKPEPIPVDVKVILIGEEELYHLLSDLEEDFPKIFKVKAEFDSTLDAGGGGLERFFRVVQRIIQEEALPPITPDGLAAVAEHAARLAGDRARLSTRFGEVADVLREACYWAKRAEPPQELLDAEAIRRAIAAQRARHDLLDRRLERELLEGVLLVDTAGAQVGRVNALGVFGAGRHGFGKPARITAAVGAGRGGLINIEREVHLSGPSHDKGVLILAGYLRQRYGRRAPLALTASLAFEQSYGEVEGDSASLAELYCLLSAISGLPVRQSLALTGSLNQHGEAQPVGGVNEKIEGYFRLCRARGLTGEQGCLLPASNEQHLMLDPEVIEACAAGRFSVWSVRTVEEGIPVVFGVTPEAFDARVEAALEAFAQAAEGSPEVVKVETSRTYQPRQPPRPSDPRPPSPEPDRD